MAALLRNTILIISKQNWHFVPLRRCIHVTGTQNIGKKWERPFKNELYKRRLEQGPEPERHRSEWSNWNYDSEIYSFGKRLGEEFDEGTLRTAFTDRSYLQKEREKRAELGLEESDVDLNMTDNEELSNKGEVLSRRYIKGYLRHSFPRLPEEGISALTEYLLVDETLSYIAGNLGIKDLILCDKVSPSNEVLSRTFKAVIGALSHDQGKERAYLFVQDFLITHLCNKTLDEIWKVEDPMRLLAGILKSQTGTEPEPRLIWETGSSTVVSAYMVGIYCNKKLIGKAAGETATIAEEMAARDALRKIFGLTISRQPLAVGEKGHKLSIDLEKMNPSISTYLSQKQEILQ